MDVSDLREYLARLDADALASLLTVRPDVAAGAPVRDLDDLATRLAHPASVEAALEGLDFAGLVLLQVFSACGADARIARAVQVLDASGSGSSREHATQVGEVAHRLQQRALTWAGEAERFLLAPGVDALLPSPLGAGRPLRALLPQQPAATLTKIARQWDIATPTRKADLVDSGEQYLSDPRNVLALLARAPETVQQVLRERAGALLPLGPQLPDLHSDPRAYQRHQVAMAWAVEYGLAFSTGSVFGFSASSAASLLLYAEMPTEVVLALVEATAVVPFAAQPPALPTVEASAVHVASSAAGAVTDFLAAAMTCLEAVARRPLVEVKSGGVGAREITRLAKHVGASPVDVRTALEVAERCGLLQRQGEKHIAASASFDSWRRLSPGRRAGELLLAWWSMPWASSIERDPESKSLPALAAGVVDPAARTVRQMLLQELGDLPFGRGVTSADALAERLSWQRPLTLGEDCSPLMLAALSEGERFGVWAHGALSGVGVALLAGDEETVAAAVGDLLPAVQESALIGSDATVVVPGSPASTVVDLLDVMAVRESKGAANTWRITATSVRSALDDGHDAEELLQRLRAISTGPLPQAVDYLVRDVARRHGHVSVQPAAVVIVSDDTALLAEIAVDRSLRALALRRVAASVLVSAAEQQEVLRALRAAGYLPRELDPHGDIVVSPQSRRGLGPTSAALPHATAGQAASEAKPHQGGQVKRGRGGQGMNAAEPPAVLAARLLSGRRPREDAATRALITEVTTDNPRLSASEVRQLAYAVIRALPVMIQYRSSTGGTTARVVSQVQIANGSLFGYCHLRQAERFFTIARILSVAPAP